MEEEDMRLVLEEVRHLEDKFDRELADSVLEVCLRENRELVEKLMGDDSMSEALLEIMEPKIIEIRRQAKDEGLEQGLEQGIRYLVDSLRGFRISEAEIKEELMGRYHLSEEDAEKYL